MKNSFVAVTCSLVLAFAAGCGDGGGSSADAAPPDANVDATPPDAAPPAPALFTLVDLPDDQLADQALALLGHEAFGTATTCSECHDLTRQELAYWRALTDQSLEGCLTDLEIQTTESAQQMIECMRAKPQADAKFQTPRIGIFSAAAELAWFEFLFQRAYGDAYQDELDEFIARTTMPRGGTPYTQEQLDIVATWFTRGLPLMDDKLPDDPRPTACLPGVSSDVGAHVAAMATTGWRAVNAENSILMHGCADAATARDCLTAYPRAVDTEFGVGWEDVLPGHVDRVLHTTDYQSAFWTRSSADGRFVAHGRWTGATGAAVIDLADGSVIDVNAFYDPAFFPDNSGFIFQRSDAFVCAQDVLSGSPGSLQLNEPGCMSTNDVGLYEHAGASLNGQDYWAIDSRFVSDSGGHEVTTDDPRANFGSTAFVRFTPMTFNGTEYVGGDSEFVGTRFEGDTVISPSAQLIVSRVAGAGSVQLGFVLRKLVATPDGSGGFDIEVPEIARYCISGGKPGFSLDERWMVIHHYIGDEDAVDLGFSGPSDPEFQAYRSQGAANVYLVELATGEVTRITNMSPGQYALFPHFRSDGWIYYQVRNVGSETEYVVASDAALMLEAAP